MLERSKQYKLAKLRQIKAASDPLRYDNPADFILNEMFIPETGAALPLHAEQIAVLRAMAERDASTGKLKYSTWLYSSPKKSAKTTIGAGVALWQAWRVPNGEIYIIGNDLKQADNRMAQAMRWCLEHNPRMKGRVKIVPSQYKITLDNGTRIESIPVDPAGEAGMNPTGLFWTEAWGATASKHELMWTEAALSPTRAGESFKFIESYAGFTGQSNILERLYDGIIKDGEAHPDAPELFTNGAAIGYWCTRRYLPWQVEAAEYYRQEAIEKTPEEFARIHDNQWASATESFIPIEWWDACRADLPPMREGQGLVMALDAAVDSDCFAVVLVGAEDRGDGRQVQVRYARKWQPPVNGKLDFGGDDGPEQEIRRLCSQYNVVVITYDPYQLHDMATRLYRDGVGFFEPFSQGQPRARADKALYDIIRDRRIVHSGEPDLREHLQNANRKPEDEKFLRLIKRRATDKIDLAVALSMAADRALYYNL